MNRSRKPIQIPVLEMKGPPEGMHILSPRSFRTPPSDSLTGHITERCDPCRDPLLLVATPVTGTLRTQDLPVTNYT